MSAQARFIAAQRKAAADALAMSQRWADLAERFLEQGDEPRAARCILQSAQAADDAAAHHRSAERAESLS